MPARPAAPKIALAFTALVAALLTLAACSSSGTSSALGTPLHQECNAVRGVLQNGPDADADPVGHAEAQPIPLRKLTITDTGLKSAVDALASADASFANTNGSAASKKLVKAASAKVNAICPGAAS
jgi:predicted component of type VI protein secretion system